MSPTLAQFAPLIASAEAEKAKAETALAQCGRYQSEQSRQKCQRKQEQAIASAEAQKQAYIAQQSQAQAGNLSQLERETKALQDLEQSEHFLQPIVKLLMGLGLPALLASFTVSLVIIGSIEVAMSYLGGILREIKEAMRAMGAEVSNPKVKARLRENPIVSALHSTSEVIAEQVGQGQALRDNLHNRFTYSEGFKQSKEQRANVEALARGIKYQPSPTLTTKEALEKLLALVTKNKPKGETFTIQELEKAYFLMQEMEGKDKVPALALGKVLAWLNSKARPTPKQPSAEGSGVTEGGNLQQPSAEGLESAFSEWLELVRGGRIKPTIKPSVRWISSRELVKGIKEIEALAYEWLERARVAGVIVDNPESGQGKAKYILRA